MNCAVIALFAYLASEAATARLWWLLAVALAVIAFELWLTAKLLITSWNVRTLDLMIADIEEADRRGEPIPEGIHRPHQNPQYNSVAQHIVHQGYTVGVDYEGRVTRIADVGQLGRAVRELRRSQGLTQTELAAAAGVSRGCVSDIERAVRGAGAASVLAVLAALGYELDICPRPPAGGLSEYAESFAGP